MSQEQAARRIRVGIIYGGRSSEHEVSLRSARAIVDAMDRAKYDVVLIGIDPEGHWHRHAEDAFRALTKAPAARIAPGEDNVALAPAPAGGGLIPLGPAAGEAIPRLDVVFPVLHGPYGEDGTMQGLLELAGIPYVGSGVLGSAVGMDKDVQKRLFLHAGLPVVDYVALRRLEWEEHPSSAGKAAAQLGLPLFVKPANLGSSVGVSKVKTLAELDHAICLAFEYDDKIVVEHGIDTREIECSVLGNERPEASLPGEVCPADEFYSYEAKYVNERGAAFAAPAPLSPALTEAVRTLAVRAFQAIECEGMARVDFFLERGTDRLFVNEVNTIPGFTAISQYPKLWEASGLPYAELIDRLLALAVERHRRRSRLRTSRE